MSEANVSAESSTSTCINQLQERHDGHNIC